KRKRLLDRIKKKGKTWKFSPSDMYERQWWEQYMEAYNQMIRCTSCQGARWWVVPADSKPLARYIVVSIILKELQKINPQIPTLAKDVAAQLDHYRAELLREKNGN
ncbi:MAG: polyphosphate kinase 2 family protein, partial [Flavobacteriales bacterium]|nr:polyphosphate kinase 2 family protein [Flavobacteriales bacterium]